MKSPGFFKTINPISVALSPVALLYFVISKVFNLIFLNAKKKINPKVISVGNIVAGGAGKTEIVKTLANILTSSGKKVAILSKGYKRSSSGDFFVNRMNFETFTVEDLGDEAYMLAMNFDVFVLSSRINITHYKEHENYDYIIMDDGHHDNSLAVDFRFLLFDSNTFIGNGLLLPAGPLREPLRAVSKVDFVVLTDFKDEHFILMQHLSRFIPFDKILRSKPEMVEDLTNLKEEHYSAFSAIGNNSKFFNFLKKNDFNVIKTYSFQDHHKYSEEELKKMIKEVSGFHGKLLTTEKDFVKIPNSYKNSIIPVKIKTTLLEQDLVLSKIL